MFSLVNGLYDTFLAPTQLNLLIVGPPGAGKTALLERLKVTEIPKRSRHPISLAYNRMTPALEKAFQKEEAANYIESSSDENSIKAPPATPQKVPTDPATPPSTPSVVVTQRRRRGLALICPAPERYRRSKEQQEEDFIVDEEEQQPLVEQTPLRTRSHSKEFEMEDLVDIDLEPAANDSSSLPKRTSTPTSSKSAESSILLQSSQEEYNLKPNAKMLPMTKIRPTIGTNLGKIDMFGAKVSIFDVGGRLQDLWERYYDDCDGVIFCWRIGDDSSVTEESDLEDDEDEETFDSSKQQEILNQVRKAIPDDVPFLVFGHVFGNINKDITEKIYDTDVLMPHYHNLMTGLCCGSAKTGAGIQSAMEWLIPLAKRQQKERLATKEKQEPKKLEE